MEEAIAVQTLDDIAVSLFQITITIAIAIAISIAIAIAIAIADTRRHYLFFFK